MKRFKFITILIVSALTIYALINLVSFRGRIEAQRQALDDLRRRVAEVEISNAELEYEIEHYNDPGVIANIARTRLGLVLPGEVIFYDGANGEIGTD